MLLLPALQCINIFLMSTFTVHFNFDLPSPHLIYTTLFFTYGNLFLSSFLIYSMSLDTRNHAHLDLLDRQSERDSINTALEFQISPLRQPKLWNNRYPIVLQLEKYCRIFKAGDTPLIRDVRSVSIVISFYCLEFVHDASNIKKIPTIKHD